MNKKIRQGKATASNLLAIARRVFAERGYQATTTQEIIDLAGITKGALYHHYASKQALFEAVYRSVEEAMGEQIRASSGAEQAPFEQLVAGCFAYLECCAADDAYRILRLDGPAALGAEAWHEIDREYGVDRLLPFLNQLQADGVIHTHDIEAFAHQLTGAMNEATFWIARQTSRAKKTAALENSKQVLNQLLQSIRI